MLYSRTRQRAADFVVRDRLISLSLCQISEHTALGAVFTDLFDPDGSELYLKLASDYVKGGRSANFYTVVEAARQRDEVALGYRLNAHASDAGKGYGMVINPDKSAREAFSERDQIIVLAQG